MTSPPLTVRQYAYFRVTGPGTHEEVTSKLGINPSEAWNAGDVNGGNGKPRRSMFWAKSSGLDDKQPLDEHILRLFLFLEPMADALRILGVGFELTLQCVGYFPPSGHGFHFTREQVRQAAHLGVALDLDFYFLDDFGHEI